MTEKKDGLHIYDEGNLSIFLHSRSENITTMHQSMQKQITKPITVASGSPDTKQKIAKRGKNFRTAKIDLVKEDELLSRIQVKTLSYNSRLTQIPRCNREQFKTTLYEYTETLKSSRVYTTTLRQISKYSNKIFGSASLSDHIRFLNGNQSVLKALFTNKKYSSKKIFNIIKKSHSAIDTRLLGIFDNTSYLETDHLNSLENALLLSSNHTDRFKAFIQS